MLENVEGNDDVEVARWIRQRGGCLNDTYGKATSLKPVPGEGERRPWDVHEGHLIAVASEIDGVCPYP